MEENFRKTPVSSVFSSVELRAMKINFLVRVSARRHGFFLPCQNISSFMVGSVSSPALFGDEAVFSPRRTAGRARLGSCH